MAYKLINRGPLKIPMIHSSAKDKSFRWEQLEIKSRLHKEITIR